MKKFARLIFAASVVALAGSLLAPAQAADEAKERAELAKALAGAKVPLHSGLQTSASHGRPISAKFEVEDGKLQLSIYTVKGDGLSEVVINPASGKFEKAETITDKEDLGARHSVQDGDRAAGLTWMSQELPESVMAAIAAVIGSLAFPELQPR
jgi:hypothetical protein